MHHEYWTPIWCIIYCIVHHKYCSLYYCSPKVLLTVCIAHCKYCSPSRCLQAGGSDACCCYCFCFSAENLQPRGAGLSHLPSSTTLCRYALCSVTMVCGFSRRLAVHVCVQCVVWFICQNSELLLLDWMSCGNELWSKCAVQMSCTCVLCL